VVVSMHLISVCSMFWFTAGQKRNRQRLLVDMIDGGEDRVPIRVVVRKRPLTSNERGRGAYKPNGQSHASYATLISFRRAAEAAVETAPR
jgi:hypothetical protein